ncbi:substrate-binding domain-containing protein [Steroidobacter flavus]|uniref:Substrate-binding domain-containing protein n=1 Tax=Steroidobacter flavus TaxID=1842136 RepID=A0ABV8T2P3_9GAMM
MSSGYKVPLLFLIAVIAALAAMDIRMMRAHSAPVQTDELRVCADPNNLPYSNERGEGFENRLAELLARDLNKKVVYTWWPQRRGFIRNTLDAGRCDIVIGVPTSIEQVRTTVPYYRSSYVFVTRRADRLHIDTFDDERLRMLRVGLHTIGDDYSNVPPAEALARRGIARNVHGYPIYGDYSKASPARGLIDAVARNEIDVAVAWGPIAGYFADRAAVPLEVSVLSAQDEEPQLAMRYSIGMGVRRDNAQFSAQLGRVIDRRRADIRELLASYGVPLVDPTHAKDSP